MTERLCRARQALGARDSVAPCCVKTEEALRAHGTVSTIEEFCRDRDFSIATDLSSSQKKKLIPRFGASQLGIRAYVYKYLGLDGHGFKSCIHCAF